MNSWNSRTDEEIRDIAMNFGYTLLGKRVTKNDYRVRIIIQDTVGYKYDVLLTSFMSQNGLCNFVDKHNPYSLYNISLWLHINGKDFELCNGNVYNGQYEKLKFYHKTCKEYFETSWSSIYAGHGCGVCNGQQLGKYNTLAYRFPEVAKEWHPTKNGDLTPNDVSYGTPRKFWWLCKKGHEFFVSVNTRTNVNSGCKDCADERKESLIATELKEWAKKTFKQYFNKEYNILKNKESGRYLPFDIYIGQSNSINGIYIEIHGHQHFKFIPHFHKSKEDFEYRKKLDTMKRKFARKNGMYIEIDLRKTKTIEQAINYIENVLGRNYEIKKTNS